jgi:flagellar FliL protein
MAEKESAASEGAQKKSSKGKLIAIVGVAVAIALAGGGALAYVLMGKKGGEQAEAKAEPKKVPVFVDLDAFTVNLRDDEADRFMQVKMTFEVKDAAGGETIKSLMPAVRSEILLLLGSKQVKDVATREGKEKLAKDVIVAADRALERTPAEKTIAAVHFQHLIIQ